MKSEEKKMSLGARLGARGRYKYMWWGYGILLPGLALLTTFTLVPFFMSFVRSFTNYDSYNDIMGVETVFVGFQNYTRIFKEERFVKSLGNVVFMASVYAVSMFVLSFTVANCYTKLSPGLTNVIKTISYIPHLMSGIVLSIVFTMLFSGDGLFESISLSLGLGRIGFSVTKPLYYLVIWIPLLWGGMGSNSIVMYAGLLNIPKDYYEAASIDGANALDKMLWITIPCMKNYFVLIIINLITGGLQMFELPYMMTGGGPMNQTITPVLFLFYEYQSPTLSYGVCLAAAILIMIPIALINGIVFKLIRSEKSVDD